MLGVAEEHGRSAVFQQLRYLIRMERSVEGNRRASRADDSEISRHPARMIRRQNGHPRLALDLVRQPGANAFRHRGEFRKGEALGAILSLDFEGDSVGKLPCGLLKTLVEGGHE